MTAIAFLNGHVDNLADDFDITVVCNFDGSESRISDRAGLMHIKISRPISPILDVVAIWKLYRFLRQEKFDIVHSVSPKAGLITALSSWLARTPTRVHWFTGQVWVLSTGLKRALLKNLDRLIYKLNTKVLVDSPSQRDFLIDQKVITSSKSLVLGSGSVAGVDSNRFRPNKAAPMELRNQLGISDPNAKIILYVGRFRKDKGLEVLISAFAQYISNPDAYLLLVGSDEEDYGDRFQELLGDRFENFSYISSTEAPEHFMAGSDVFCLPSFREGFGLTLIEASSCGLPVVATRIYGITDAVEDEVTGLLCEPNNLNELETCLNRLLESTVLRDSMGRAGRNRVLRDFQSERLQRDLKIFYLGVALDNIRGVIH
jgi:glycosyltransferase involved in cell wall biosynthesis